MNRRLMTVLLSILLALSLAPRPALARGSHIDQAIHHAREAVVAGREGKPSLLVRHATEALHHAKAQQQERPNAEVKEAIARLEQGIRHGERKWRSATRIVYRALQQLERAPR